MSLDEEAADELPADEDEDVDEEGLEARRRRNPGRRRVARMGQCGILGTVWDFGDSVAKMSLWHLRHSVAFRLRCLFASCNPFQG